MDCVIDRSTLKIIAHQKFETANPSINLSAKSTTMAFITNKKSPRVNMVAGNVKITNIGFTNTFKIESTTTTINAPVYPFTLTPESTLAKIKTATAFNKSLMIQFIRLPFA
ncbi:hypothetical protein MHTCC0001_26940 [Flavobacteriaceae bacterium MHTCC 0001]